MPSAAGLNATTVSFNSTRDGAALSGWWLWEGVRSGWSPSEVVRSATTLAAAKPSASTKAPDISTVKGAPAGATIGAFVQGQGYEVKDSKGKLIGYAKGS